MKPFIYALVDPVDPSQCPRRNTPRLFGVTSRKKSAALLGNTRALGTVQPKEANERRSAALIGRKLSDEHRANISAAKKQMYANKKQKEKS